MTTQHRSGRHVLALVTIVVLSAACGGGGPTAAPAAATGPIATTAARTTAPSASVAAPTTAGGGAPTDACALLTDADVKEITGYPVASKNPNPADTIFPSACEWRVKGAAWQIVLGVTSPGGQAEWDKLVPYLQGKAVTGIGDEAFLSEMGGDLMARRGDTFIDVQYVAAGEPKDTQERLAKRVLEHVS